MTPTLVACDLDRTLIYSAAAADVGRAAAPGKLVCVELYGGGPLSFATARSLDLLAELATASVLVPTTTRTREQYARVDLLPRTPRFAVTSNGGHLLVDGRADEEWTTAVRQLLDASCAPLADIAAHLTLTCGDAWVRKRRVAEDMFAYLVIDRSAMPPAVPAELAGWCGPRGWAVSLQGRKLYCVPAALTKGAALAEIARRAGTTRLLAAGDSLLDLEMLARADAAIRPAHGELHETGWMAPHVTVTRHAGALAGEEISGWLLDRAQRERGQRAELALTSPTTEAAESLIARSSDR